jgi:CDP-diacylglycerol--glycerol-3-phosphate 3-phosphatidyltransferase
MLDRHGRATLERGIRPVAGVLRRLGVTPDALTATGLLCSVGAAVAIGSGHHSWGIVALGLSGLTDIFDGAVAKVSGAGSPRGAFFDSVADRVSDSLVLGGAAWWLAGEEPRLAVLAFAALALSLTISYERAKAESLGFDARGGVMERAERMILIGIGLAFNLLEVILWVMVALTAFTAVQRFAKVWRQAGAPVVVPVAPRRARARPPRPRPRERVGPPEPWALARWWNARVVRTSRRPGEVTRRRRARTRP